MRFQIVMPVLNQARYITRAIESVLQQAKDVKLELIIIDGVSTDSTLPSIERTLERFPGASVTVVSEPDEGQSDAINKGALLGSADIISWLNADDLLLPGSLRRVRAAYDSALPETVAIYGNVRFIDANGSPTRELREQHFRRRDLVWGPCYIPQPSTFIRRDAWMAVGGLDQRLHYAMDLDLWLRLSELGRILHIPEILSEYRLHAAAKSVAQARSARAESRRVRQFHAAKQRTRQPSLAELEARYFAVRCLRKVRFAVRRLRGPRV